MQKGQKRGVEKVGAGHRDKPEIREIIIENEIYRYTIRRAE